MKNKIYSLLILITFSCSSGDDPTIAPIVFPELIEGTLNYQNLERRYALHIPTTYDGTQETPLVVFLHGGGGNITSAQNFTLFNRVSDENGFLVLYPQGSYESIENSFVWADGRGLPPDNQGIDDVGFINELVATIKTEYNINAKKVYICGFSNGSFLTQKIAFENNSQFAAMATLGGTMHQSFFDMGNPNRTIPMMYLFGTEDHLVPYNGGFVSNNPDLAPVVGIEDAVNFWVTNNQCQTTLPVVEFANINTDDNSTVTVFEYTDGIDGAKVIFYKINGGGHTWPGVSIPNESLGVVNLDILASEELWKFFNQFELN